MPQIAKGGKYVFAWSTIRDDGSIVLPAEAAAEYELADFEKVILISGSRSSGGMVVAKAERIAQSAMAAILSDNPLLESFQMREGELLPYKGRMYGWSTVHPGKILKLSSSTMAGLKINPQDRLLVIRGSYIGFVMALKGPIIAAARAHAEIIVV